MRLKGLISRVPHSPGLAVALVALVLAVGGGSFALGSSTARQQKRIATKVVRGLAPKLSVAHATTADSASAAGVAARAESATRADTATSADHATEADIAVSAAKADNSDELGGIPASGYTRSDCGSLTGQVKGFVRVTADGTFSSTFTSAGLIYYNCSGQAVEARRIGAGVYEVRFLGNPAQIAVGSADVVGEGTPPFDAVTVSTQGAGDWKVSIFRNGTGFADDRFALVVP